MENPWLISNYRNIRAYLPEHRKTNVSSSHRKNSYQCAYASGNNAHNSLLLVQDAVFPSFHNMHILGQGDRAKKLIGRDRGWGNACLNQRGAARAQDMKNRLFEGALHDPNVNFHCLALASKCHILCGS